MREAWLDTTVTPSFHVFKAMHDTRAAMRAETIPGFQLIIVPRTDPVGLRAADEDRQDIEDMIAGLPSREPDNRLAAAQLLLSLRELDAEQRARVAPYAVAQAASATGSSTDLGLR